MALFRNVVFVAAIAGLLAGIVMTALQTFSTVPLIHQAEVFEKAGGGHEHAAAATDPATTEPAAAEPPMTAVPVHEHDAEAWEPSEGFERYAYTVLANLVTGVGFGLLLVAASEFAGGIGSWRTGVLWGLAGFAVFTLAPGLGLPPELPAMPAAELAGRQLWWWATVVATAAGLALIAFRGTALYSLIGVALISAPHIVGAPQPVSYEGPIPEGLHHQFVVAVTITNLVFWVVLGGIVGVVRNRLMQPAASMRDSFA